MKDDSEIALSVSSIGIICGNDSRGQGTSACHGWLPFEKRRAVGIETLEEIGSIIGFGNFHNDALGKTIGSDRLISEPLIEGA